MTTYPAASDLVAAMTRPDGTEAHSSMHGRTLDIWENALHYGADPTGVSNSSTAIQAAIDALPVNGGGVYIPKGKYKITSTINMDNYVSLRGAGQGTCLVPQTGANPMIKVDTKSGTRIEHMNIGAPLGDLSLLPTATGEAVYLTGGVGGQNDNHITDVLFVGMQGTSTYALKIENNLEVMVSRCHFYGCHGGGITFTGNANAGVVRDCLMSNTGLGALSAIFIEQVDGIGVYGTVIEAWAGDYGINVYGSLHCTIEGNWFEDNIGPAIHSDTSHNLKIIGNNIQGAVTFERTHYSAIIAGNNLSTGNITLSTDSAAATNGCNYFLTGNSWTGASLVDNTNSSRDSVVMISDRDQTGGGANTHRGLVVYKGPFDHRGDKVGFFGVTPAARASAYTVTNVSADRAYDANATTTDELADVLGTLIADLKLYGLLQ